MNFEKVNFLYLIFVIITIMEPRIDDKDRQILGLLQKNCRMTAKEIAKTIDSPVTTVFAKIKRMEQLEIIRDYKAVLDAQKLNKGTTAFILASVSYKLKAGTSLSQRKIAEEIAKFAEVQEVHIITGDWDILIKIKERDVDRIGRFVVDRLRIVEGIERTLTSMVFETQKETTDLVLPG
jgi:Lrp/AsnC family leucine-responsive transcriptional regulator